MNDDELTEAERRALDAWPTLPPPAGFADRVLAAREAAATAPARRRARWPLVAGGLAACAVAATALVWMRTPSRAASGQLVAEVRTTTALGDRAVAVAEPSATLTWQIDDDGDAVIEQRAGDVFYRVDRGGPFVVHTPAGDVHVTGTCFRVEVQMNKTKQLLLSGTVGAAIAAGVVVTVYEGRVIADSSGARTELAAGQRATLSADGRTLVAGAAATPDGATESTTTVAMLDERSATREQLVARSVIQRGEIAKLRTRVTELEGKLRGHHDSGAEDGRPWHDPSPERLKEWVAECHVRADEPGLDRWEPATSLGKNERGLEPGELAAVNAALSEVQAHWKQLVRALYLEATGDTAGVDSLSPEAMRGEIQEKGSPEDHNLILQRIANERAGYAQPPADLSRTSPYERLMRAYVALGDQAEAALAKRLGPERAAQIRGDGWSSRSDWSGCPRDPSP